MGTRLSEVLRCLNRIKIAGLFAYQAEPLIFHFLRDSVQLFHGYEPNNCRAPTFSSFASR